jgi:peptidyl-prolyl cis-trans isomerase C
LVIVALAALCAVSACRRNPAEQSAAAQTPAPQSGGAQPGAPQENAPVPAKPLPAELPDVLAKVNGQPVTRAEFERLVKNMESSRGPIPAEQRDQVLRGALDQLITYTVLKQEAAARNLSVTDADVDSQLSQMQKQFPNEGEFNKALSDRNTTMAQLKSDARADMVINKLVEGELAGTLAATPAEARAFYDQNPDKFTQPETVRASHILLTVAKDADDATRKAARAKIEGLLKRARSGEDFAALAREHSQDGSASQGGDLGLFPRGRMVPEFEQAAFGLAPGQVSDVVTTQFGFHIIKMVEKKEPSTVPFEQVSPRIIEYLSNEKKQQRVESFIEEAKKRAKIEVLV